VKTQDLAGGHSSFEQIQRRVPKMRPEVNEGDYDLLAQIV